MKMPIQTLYKVIRQWLPIAMIGLLIIPCLIQANPVPESRVRTAVQTWVRRVTADRKPDASISRMEPFGENGVIYAYVADIDQGGFCLCGADDIVLPVYLYNPTGEFDPDNPDYQYFLWEITSRTQELSEGLRANDPDLLPYREFLDRRRLYWADLSSGIVPPLQPKIDDTRTDPDSMTLNLTSQWSQDSPYNDQCPWLSGSEQTIVGCVATAMSQIMYYWQRPNTGVGSGSTAYNWRDRSNWDEEPLSSDPGIPANWGGGNRLEWTSANGGRLRMNGLWDGSVYQAAVNIDDSNTPYLNALNTLYGRLTPHTTTCSANFGAATYLWNLIQDHHTDPPDPGDAAVAMLCYHAGISVSMDYGIWASGASTGQVPVALADHFRYDSDGEYGLRDINPMTEEIQWLRPVQLRGCHPTSGCHSWVVYGYDKATDPNREFLMNLGWGPGSESLWYCCDSISFHDNQWQATKLAPVDVVKFVGNTVVGDGSPNDPYLNIIHALVYAPDNATLIFKAGTTHTFSSDSLVIDRPLTLKGYNVTIRRQ